MQVERWIEIMTKIQYTVHINTCTYCTYLNIKKDSTTYRAIGRHQTTVTFTNESLYYSIYSECHRKTLYMKKGNRNVKVLVFSRFIGSKKQRKEKK